MTSPANRADRRKPVAHHLRLEEAGRVRLNRRLLQAQAQRVLRQVVVVVVAARPTPRARIAAIKHHRPTARELGLTILGLACPERFAESAHTFRGDKKACFFCA